MHHIQFDADVPVLKSVMRLNSVLIKINSLSLSLSLSVSLSQSVGHLTRKSGGPGLDTRSGNILSFLLPLFQEGQLSVTGESMCTKYWLTD